MLGEKWAIGGSKFYSLVDTTNRSVCNKNVNYHKKTYFPDQGW